MKKFNTPAPAPFAILPWEHEGTRFDAMSGATVRAEIGDKKRSFLIRTRGGRIFFKEPSRGQMIMGAGVRRVLRARASRSGAKTGAATGHRNGPDSSGKAIFPLRRTIN